MEPTTPPTTPPGSVPVTVKTITGETVSVNVLELPIRQMQALAEAQEDSEVLTALYTGNDTAWAGTLTRESAMQVLDVGDRINGQFFARWVATRLMMSAVEKSASAADTIAKLPSAILSSITSGGWAAVIGAAAVVGVLAAAGARAFQSGGYTGDGPVNSVAGFVHRGEYVSPAPQVSRMGVGNIESAMAGLGGGGSQNIAFFDDGSKLSDWARTQEGETVIVDVVRRNLHRFGQA